VPESAFGAGLSPSLTAGAIAFGAAAIATWSVRYAALTLGWVEQPRADRWHRRPTARFGGIGILAGLAVGLTAFGQAPQQLIGLSLLAVGMFTIGLVDDVIGLRPQSKLVAQIGAAVLLYLIGFRFNAALPWAVDFFVVLFWVVAITNAMNLLDNMDGLAAGIAVIAGLFRFLLYQTDGNTAGAVSSAIFVGAVAGFLVFNFSPASIFMGDCGSFLVGFVLAALNLTTRQMYAKSLVAILLFPALVLAIPIFDTTFVSVVRWFSGRRVSQGGADHTSHRLVAVGLSERQAVLVLYGISIASGAMAYALYRVGFSYAWFGAGLCVLALVLFGIFLSSVSVYAEEQLPADVRLESVPRFTLATQFMYKRAMLWILVDVLVLVLAYYAGFMLRYGHTPLWRAQFATCVGSAPLAVVALLVPLATFGLYRTDWQTFSLHEARIIALGTTLGMLTQTAVLWAGFEMGAATLGVTSIAWGATILGLTGSRGIVRALAEWVRRDDGAGTPVLVYGAGAGGELALRELRMNAELGKRVVGFIDDDHARHRTLLHGVPVFGGGADVTEIVRAQHAGAIVVATRKLSDERLADLMRAADRLGIPVYRLAVDLEPIEEPSRLSPLPVRLAKASQPSGARR
jgi:UDP-GlcNAc:undecaprenyl-phosphate GlcNAc-1-phosphate transferase